MDRDAEGGDCISVEATVSLGSRTRSATSAGSIDTIATINHHPQRLYPSLRTLIYKRAESRSVLSDSRDQKRGVPTVL